MIVHFITVFVISIVLILCTWAAFRTFKKPLPGSLIPMLIGGTVIFYGIYSEYTWASRTLAQMPASIKVVHRISSKSVFSPWSYVVPRTDRLSVVDTAGMLRNPEHPHLVMLDLLLLQRFSPVIRARQVVDCEVLRRADLGKEPQFDEQGLPLGVQWQGLEADHTLVKVACAE